MDPNVVAQVIDKPAPLRTAAEKAVGATNFVHRTVVYADGHTDVYEYDKRQGTPALPSTGQGLSNEQQQSQGTLVTNGFDQHQRAEWDRQQAAGAKAPAGVHVVNGVQVQTTYGPDGKPIDTPVENAPVKPPAPHTYSSYPLPGGQFGVMDSATGVVSPLLMNGQPVVDQVAAQQAVAHLNSTLASTASTNVQTGIAVNTDARNNAIYNRDTTRQQVQDDQALQQTAFNQGRQVAGDRLNYQYTLPRQAALDANQARAYQNQDAERMVTAATQRQTAGQTAGNSAFDRAKYMAENSIGPEGVAAMRGAAGGAPVNPGQFVMPMPRFEDIFGGARSQAMQEIPTYSQAQAQTPAYQTFQPNYDDIMAQYNQYISPYSAVFGPRQG